MCTVYGPITGEYRYKGAIVFEIGGAMIALTLAATFTVPEVRKTRRATANV